MVNTDMVNGRGWRLKCAHFRDFLLVFTQILHFKNPVKYVLIFDINQRAAPQRVSRQSSRQYLSRQISMLASTPPLTLIQGASAILLQNRKAASIPPKVAARAAGRVNLALHQPRSECGGTAKFAGCCYWCEPLTAGRGPSRKLACKAKPQHAPCFASCCAVRQQALRSVR
jgi:hypothetical protein